MNFVRDARCGLFATICMTLAAPQLLAVDLLWEGAITAGPHAWNTTTNWTSANVPNDNTERANLQRDWSAAPTFNLGGAITINGILADDTGSTGDVALTLANGGTASRTITLAGTTPVMQINGSTLTVSAVMAGTTAWSKTGAGILVLSGANTFSGDLTVSDGTLRAGSAAALGNSTNILVQNAENPAAANTNALELAGGFTFGTGKTLTLRNNSTTNTANARSQFGNQAGNNTWAGAIILDGGTNQTLLSGAGVMTINGNVGVSATPPTNLFIRGVASGVMNGNFNIGTTGILKTDTGTWTINSTGNTHGQTTVANGTVVLNNNEALASVTNLSFGEANANTGTLTINAGFTQTIGNITVPGTSTTTTGHRLNGAGSIDLGATQRAFTINNATAPDDLTISTPLLGSGGFIKSGAGTLVLNAAVTGPVTVSAGVLSGNTTAAGGLTVDDAARVVVGSPTVAWTMAAPTLTLGAGATTLDFNVGPGGDQIMVSATNGLTADGTTTINLTRYDSTLPVGTYPLISYNGTRQGAGSFTLGTLPPYLTANIIEAGSAVTLNVTASDSLVWTGSTDANWDTTTGNNWKLASNSAAALYLDAAAVTFGDSGLNPTVNVVAAINPGWVTFSNSTSGPAWRIAGLAINGTGGISKTNTGTATLANAVGVTGPILVKQGTLEVDHDTGSITATPQVDVAAGATLLLSRDNGDFTFNRSITGTGTVVIDPVTSTTSIGSRSVTLSGNNTGFTGLLKLTPSGTVASNGSFRTVSTTGQANLGAATVEVDPGGQLWFSNPINNNLTITGAGFNEAAGGTPTTAATDLAGNPLTVPNFTYGGIGAIRMEASAVITGTVTLDGDAKIMPYGTTGTISGPITNTNPTDTLVVGGGTSTGSSTLIASGDLTGLERIWINGGGTTGTAVLQLGANGTTGELAANVDIILYTDAAGASFRVNRSDGFTLGAGQKIIAAHNGTATNLSRASFTVNTTGSGLSLNGNKIDLSDGTTGGTVYVAGQGGGGNGVAGSILKIDAGAVLDAGSMFLCEGGNLTATVEQTGGTTTLINQLRVGHYNANGFYNLSGGSVSITGPSPLANPSNTGATEQNGGIYLGVDGTGVFNQSGGTVTTNFVVLDNRGDTVGTDQYNLSAGTLNLAGTWGIIRRNTSAEFNFSGGTIRNAGSDLTATIDCPLVISNSPTLDTNGATNSLILAQGLAGNAGTLTAQGGGTVVLNGTSTFTGALAITDGTTLSGIGTFPGIASVTNISPGTGSAAGAIGTLTLGDAGAGTTTTTVAGTLTADLNVASTTTGNDLLAINDDVNLAAAKVLPRFYGGAPTAGTYKLMTYTGTRTGAPTFDPSFVPGDYRMAFSIDTSVDKEVNLILSGATGDLIWAGDNVTNTWDLNNSATWTGFNKFYQLDSVTFTDAGSATPAVKLTGTLLPSAVTVNSGAKNYTFDGTGAISGGALLTKQGLSQLTVLTNNSNIGGTDIQEGIVQVGNGGTSGWLGSGAINIAGELQFNRSDAVNLTSLLSGSGPLVQEGSGTLTLAGTNTITGEIRVTAGVLKAANIAAFGTSSGITVNSGAQVNLNGTAFGNTRSYSYTAAGTGPDGRGAIINETANIGANAAVVNLTLTNHTSVGAYGGTGDGNRFDIGYNGTTFGTITGGGFTLTKLGDGMVNVRAAATDISYVVAAGSMRVENSSDALGSTGVKLNSGTRLDIYGALNIAVPITLAGDALITSSSAANTLASNIGESVPSVLTLGSGTTPVDLTVIGNNTYTGGTLVQVPVIAGSVTAFGPATGTVTIAHPTVNSRITVQDGVTIANPLVLNASFGTAGRGMLQGPTGGIGTWSGPITITGGPSAGGHFSGAGAGAVLKITGAITSTVNVSHRDYTLELSGGGSYPSLTSTNTLRIGANDGVATNAVVTLGGSAACTFDLNGFNQTLAGLLKGGSAATVTNTIIGTPSTLTLDIATATNTYAGIITGDVTLVKSGAGELRLSGAASTFTGNVLINAGLVTVNAGHNDANPTSALGDPTLGTRSVTVKSGATLAFAANDTLGNAGSSPVLPIIVEAGGVLTNLGFNTVGPVTLNGATMTSTGGANATFQSYRLFGTITAGGTAASVMSASGTNSGYHLHSNTTFDVANATSDASADLTVSAALLNQSGTQASAAGNLIKTGVGTMVLSGTNAYTGNTTVDAGTLQLADNAQLRFAIGAASGTNNSLSGTGTVILDGDFAIDTTAAAALITGTWLLEDVSSLSGAYGATFQVVTTDGTPWTNAGDVWTTTTAGGRTWTFDETTGTLTLVTSGYDSWAAQIPDAGKRARGDDPDGDGFTNGQEFLFGTSPNVGDGSLTTSSKSGGNLILQWLQRENGASYLLKESPTLDTGSWTTSAITPVLDDQTGAPADYDRFKATIPIDSGRKFFRIEGTEN